MDFRHVDLAQAYRLTFAATQNVREKIRVARFAFLPPRHVLSAQYDTPPYAFGIPLYTRHIWDRGRAYLQSRVSNL